MLARSTLTLESRSDRATRVITRPPGRSDQRIEHLSLARLIGFDILASELLRDLPTRGHRHFPVHLPRELRGHFQMRHALTFPDLLDESSRILVWSYICVVPY